MGKMECFIIDFMLALTPFCLPYLQNVMQATIEHRVGHVSLVLRTATEHQTRTRLFVCVETIAWLQVGTQEPLEQLVMVSLYLCVFVYSLQKWRRNRSSFFHVSYVSVYLGRQRWSPTERTHFVHVFFVPDNKQQVFHIANVWNSSNWIEAARKGFSLFFWLGTPSPLRLPIDRRNVIHMIKWTRPSPLRTVSHKKLDGGKAWD